MFVAHGTKISECEHVKNILSKLHSFIAVQSETKEKLINNNGVKTNFNVNQERKESLQPNTMSCVQRTPVKKLPKFCCPWPTSFKLCESLPWRGLLCTTDAASNQYFFNDPFSPSLALLQHQGNHPKLKGRKKLRLKGSKRIYIELVKILHRFLNGLDG